MKGNSLENILNISVPLITTVKCFMNNADKVNKKQDMQIWNICSKI